MRREELKTDFDRKYHMSVFFGGIGQWYFPLYIYHTVLTQIGFCFYMNHHFPNQGIIIIIKVCFQENNFIFSCHDLGEFPIEYGTFMTVLSNSDNNQSLAYILMCPY